VLIDALESLPRRSKRLIQIERKSSRREFGTQTGTTLGGVYLPVSVIVLCLVARWILIVGFGDFGTDHEMVSRLIAGQWQGRDFFAIYPPLSGYSLLLFEKTLGNNYIVLNIHLWFWWIMNWVVAAKIMRAYGGSRDKVALVAVAVALLTAPPNMHMASFAYMASTLSGLSLVCTLQYSKTPKRWLGLFAGGVGGVAIMAKPNVGIAIVAALVAACGAIAILQHKARKKYLILGLLILVGSMIGGLAAIAIPGWYGGYGELAKEVFVGGSQIKGGVLSLALRAFPRITTTFDPPLRYIVEIGITLPLLALLTTMCWRLCSSKSKGYLPAVKNTEPTRTFATEFLWLLCGIVVALSIWSLWPRTFPHRFVEVFSDLRLVSLPFFLWQILYLVILVALAVSLAVGAIRKEYSNDLTLPFWASFICLIWMLGVGASGRHNSVFAATLFMPMLVLQYGRGRERSFYATTITVLSLWTVAWHLAPNWRSTFARLTPLPTNSKFAGLYWPENGASRPGSYPVWSSSKVIEALQKNVSPRVEGQSTLWLEPGPGAAFGGSVYSYGITGLASNNVPIWAEKKFGDGVRANPPQYIISSRLTGWQDPKWTFMRPDVILPWLRGNYRIVWELTDSEEPLVLWQKK